MNDNDPANLPPPIPHSPDPVLPPSLQKPRPFIWWFKKLFACNPFYPVSAALLLYGCYRVSLDAPLFNLETARLWFNFTSVQLYEILLVTTAIFLARRRLWYDSTLLAGLENLLVFVPFILVSQAALIEPTMAVVMCLAGAAVTVVRFGSLKKYFHQLNLPDRLLEIGSILLALNVALPLIYRHFGQTKIGVHIDSGAAYEMNEFTWLLILPTAMALVNLLPRARSTGVLLPQHRWLPIGFFSLWITVTCLHLYGLDYIYQFDLRGELIAPTAWVLAWTLFLRVPARSVLQKSALTLLPLFVPLLSASPGGTGIFLILTTLNLGAYCAVGWVDRGNGLARHLVFATTLLAIGGLPDDWLQSIVHGQSRTQCIAAGLITYLMVWSALLRNPKLAVLGSATIGVGIMSLFDGHPGAIHWAIQGALVFLLLHSLRWEDGRNPGAGMVRTMTAVMWVLQTVLWMDSETGKFWMSVIPGTVVLGTYLAGQIPRERWEKRAVPVAALLVILSSPGNAVAKSLLSTPVGLLAVLGGFLLFGCGTLAALTRHHWQKHESNLDTEPPSTPDKKD